MMFGARRTQAPQSPKDRVTVEAFWEFVAFAANSLARAIKPVAG